MCSSSSCVTCSEVEISVPAEYAGRRFPKRVGSCVSWEFPPCRYGGAGIAEGGSGAAFEVDLLPCSYGFRTDRRAQDAIAKVHNLARPPETTIGFWRPTSRCASARPITHLCWNGGGRGPRTGRGRKRTDRPGTWPLRRRAQRWTRCFRVGRTIAATAFPRGRSPRWTHLSGGGFPLGSAAGIPALACGSRGGGSPTVTGGSPTRNLLSVTLSASR